IAHDFNNILNIIQGYSSLIAAEAGENQEIPGNLKVINEAIKRGAGVVQQLLTMARKTEAHLEPTDLNAVVQGLAGLLKGTFPKNIDVGLDLEAELPALLADPNQINQALLNLSVNARDAMPEGGSLRLKTRAVDGDALPDWGEPKAGRYVCVEVIDEGMGIQEEIRSRVFEPFFTTKESEKGTGLGLAVVYGIVKNHQGRIELQSGHPRGTTFRILLPVRSAEEPGEIEGPDRAGAEGQGSNSRGGTALVVEDEEATLHLLRNLLAERGYRVLTAVDGEEAAERYRHNGDMIDVVLLDLDLPKISGVEVLRKIRARNPNARVMITSGYLEPELKSALAREGVCRFIQKPYVPDEIVAALKDSDGAGPEPDRHREARGG
ncbi:MAG TPA: response regulator, partial [Candidatus Binatia bacterium]